MANTKNTKNKTSPKKKTTTSKSTTTKKQTGKTNQVKRTTTSTSSTKKTTSSSKAPVKKQTSKTNQQKKKTPTKSTTKKSTSAVKKTVQISKHPKKITLWAKIKIFLLSICKVVLIFFKNVKNSINTQYNKIRRGSAPKKNKIKKEKKKPINKDDDDLILLRYRDYHGFAKITVFFINRIKVVKYDMKRFKKKYKYGTLKDKVLIILMLILITGFSMVVAFCGYIIVTAPEISEKRLYKNNSSVVLDKNGIEIARLGAENREKVTYDELPEVLVDAIVATEDSRFFKHNGIDIARFTKAVIGQLLGHSDAGGGSTLTMQVSKNAATTNVSSGIQGIIRKFTDIYLSVFVFEKKYTKEQIMEFYVNIPNLGSHSYGVEQASQTYFGKSVSELNLAEAATIAGLFQAPSAYNPYVYPEKAEVRRNIVLNLMHRHGYITKEERDAAKAVSVESLLVGIESSKLAYQGFIDTVAAEIMRRTATPSNKKGDDPANIPMTIWTTLDTKRQDVVNDIMTGKTYKWKNDVVQAGIVVIDVKDGSIAAIGNGRNLPERGYNFATSAKRHPGSVAKPVLDYGPAIEYLNWGTGQNIVDKKMTYSGGASIKNFDNKFEGVLTIKQALSRSRNIPALFAFQQTSNKQKSEFASNLGWEVQDDGNGNILESCSIGGFEGISSLEAAAAFATFARGGTYIEPYSFTKIEYMESGAVFEVKPKKVKAMSETTAYLINMILKYAVTSGKVAVTHTSGTDIAGKTGTSTVDSHAKKLLGIKHKNVIGDSWEVTYSPDYAISLWYGYSPQLSKEHYLTGSEGSAARREISKKLSKGIYKKNSRFKQPKGIVTAEIEIGTDPVQLASPATPKELRSKEYFKRGFVPTTVSTRFSELANVTNLKYSSTNTSVSLSWDKSPLPDAINQEYLTNYFKESKMFKRWADDLLKERLEYNTKTFGQFGYHVYMVNEAGITTDLGFTTNNTFTTNVTFDSNTRFVVKTSYSKFKANQSSGTSVTVAPNQAPTEDPTTTTKPTESNTYSVEYIGPSCSTVSAFKALGPNASDKLRIMANGKNVTKDAHISYSCFNNKDDEVNCNSLVDNNDYTILFSVNYNNSNRQKRITLKSKC